MSPAAQEEEGTRGKPRGGDRQPLWQVRGVTLGTCSPDRRWGRLPGRAGRRGSARGFPASLERRQAQTCAFPSPWGAGVPRFLQGLRSFPPVSSVTGWNCTREPRPRVQTGSPCPGPRGAVGSRPLGGGRHCGRFTGLWELLLPVRTGTLGCPPPRWGFQSLSSLYSCQSGSHLGDRPLRGLGTHQQGGPGWRGLDEEGVSRPAHWQQMPRPRWRRQESHQEI